MEINLSKAINKTLNTLPVIPQRESKSFTLHKINQIFDCLSEDIRKSRGTPKGADRFDKISANARLTTNMLLAVLRKSNFQTLIKINKFPTKPMKHCMLRSMWYKIKIH